MTKEATPLEALEAASEAEDAALSVSPGFLSGWHFSSPLQILLILSAGLIPAILTLATIQTPQRVIPAAHDPSPYGYTVSLLF